MYRRIAVLTALALSARLGAGVVASPFYQVVSDPFARVEATTTKPRACALFGMEARSSGGAFGWQALALASEESRFVNSGWMYPAKSDGTRIGPDQWMSVSFSSSFGAAMAGPRISGEWAGTELSASQLWGWGTYTVRFPQFKEAYSGGAMVFETLVGAGRSFGPLRAELSAGYLQAVSPSLTNASGHSVQGEIDYGGFTGRLSLGFEL